MFREIFNNIFSTTSNRGRLEYFWVTLGLNAAVALFVTFGLAAQLPFVSYALLFVALVAQIGVWFVASQRVRDIGWNVPLFLAAGMLVSGLASSWVVTENSALLAVGGPWSIVLAGMVLALTLVPGDAYREYKAARVSA
jgi:uncharacterized membrane protein YhaH (DUF805 family)